MAENPIPQNPIAEMSEHWESRVTHIVTKDAPTCWPGMDVTAPHLQDPSIACAFGTDKRTLMVEAPDGYKVLIKRITVTAYGLTSPYVNVVGTFSTGNLTTDIYTFVCGATAQQVEFDGPYRTEKKKLWLNTVSGPDDSNPVIINIAYQFVP